MNSILFENLQQPDGVALDSDIKSPQASNRGQTDEELMALYADGDVRSFEQLYARHKGGLYRFFVRQCRGQEVAEELFQEVWIKIINARKSYQQSAKFTTFLYKVAQNRLIDHYRHCASMQYSQKYEGDNQELVERCGHDADPGFNMENEQLKHRLQQAIEQLPAEQKIAFVMQQDSHLSLSEIAEITDASRETVKSRLRYAHNKLRDTLKESQPCR
ncbi:MAG: RNA polymerase sigma factor [Kangiellaceae bacterium]|jgi:RNA polymerase sigma-70 factor (ECF subfamily)|nr:RNA polymerase sigma factor [Kangiellaceae bacterium]